MGPHDFCGVMFYEPAVSMALYQRSGLAAQLFDNGLYFSDFFIFIFVRIEGLAHAEL